MFDGYARHAGERSFRDFFPLPPTKENRSQIRGTAWDAVREIRAVRSSASPPESPWPTLQFEPRRLFRFGGNSDTIPKRAHGELISPTRSLGFRDVLLG
jgi:hypothetical protein